MNTKLTLNLDRDVIENAKKYAKNKHQSLSQLVENYFKFLFEDFNNENNSVSEYSPLVNELSGIIEYKGNEKEDYLNYLMKKHK